MEWVEEVLLCLLSGGVLTSAWELSGSLFVGLSEVAALDASELWPKVKVVPAGEDGWNSPSLVDLGELSFSTVTAQEGFRSSISISILSASGTVNKLALLMACPAVRREFLGEGGVITVFGLWNFRHSIGLPRGGVKSTRKSRGEGGLNRSITFQRVNFNSFRCKLQI